MSRDAIPLYIDDLSQFSKSLRKALQQQPDFPSHLTMLGLIARAAGHRNYQSLTARQILKPDLPPPDTKALRVFDEAGRMIRWPSRRQTQDLCLWVLWDRMPPCLDLSEPQVNDILRASNGFGDHVLLRRSMISHKLMRRSVDGRVYRRLEQQPPEPARALIRALKPSARSGA